MVAELLPIKHVVVLKGDGTRVGNVPVVLQTKNGPCFLIALINALILKSAIFDSFGNLSSNGSSVIKEFILKLKDSRNIEMNEILNVFVNCLTLPDDASDNSWTVVRKQQSMHNYNLYKASTKNNFQIKNMDILLDALPNLNDGLNINPKLDEVLVSDYYELTLPIRELLNVFELPMYHAFIMPEKLCKMAQNRQQDLDMSFDSFQNLMITLMESKEPPDTEMLSKFQNFFSNSTTQLTDEGLHHFANDTSKSEIGLFFRNDHFSTFIRHVDELRNNHIYLLVSDAGIRDLSEVIWQELTINDNGDFLNASYVATKLDEEQIQNFTNINKRDELPIVKSLNEVDLMMAKQLQVEEDEIHAWKMQENINKLQRKQHEEIVRKRKEKNQVAKKPVKRDLKKKNKIDNCILM
ncbi:ubiquitinyl hydrolase 1 [Martiniozyma asiatica (nom. inval.)]|nr:ubiquitinyl hydrolase 1 [Martiniozyma asiatica]